jgi:putative SOS response-associated peptidase YedK
MCGRTALSTSPDDLREAFGLDESPPLIPHYNVPPSQPVAVVRVLRNDPGRKMDALRWGLIPAWAKDKKLGHKLTLARIETVATTPAFRDALRRRRCLVVVDGFYEWQRGAGNEKKKSQPFFVRRADKAPFALAGVWERWVSSDGEVVESCAVLTQPARPPVDAVHDRMPLVLEREAWDRWLDPALVEANAIAHLIEPASPALVAYPVSSHVNDPRNDDAACLKPLQEEKEPPQEEKARAPLQGSLF